MTIILSSNIILKCDNNSIIEKCIRENTFTNPIYISNEINHRSNRNIEKTIITYNFKEDGLILPRGYMRDLLKTFNEKSIIPKLIDERVSRPCQYPERLNQIILRPYQARAVDASLKYDQGVIVSPTGSGKSLIGLEIIRNHKQKSLIIVHRSDLAKQWVQIIQDRLGLVSGLIGEGQWQVGEEITVAMIQTLTSKQEESKKLKETFGLILVDETHHTPSESFSQVIGNMKAKYLYGLSATVERRDGLEQKIYRCIGPSIETISRDEVEKIGATVPAVVKALDTRFSPFVNSWNDYLIEISANTERNLLIVDLATNEAIPVLILCDRVSHAEHLSGMLSRRDLKHVLAHGQIKNRDEVMEEIKKAKITIATASLIGEGIDVSSWGILIMASPISSEIKLMQAIGRIVRPAPGKEIALVYDLRDDCGFSGASFKKRFSIYKKNKIYVEFNNKNEEAAA